MMLCNIASNAFFVLRLNAKIVFGKVANFYDRISRIRSEMEFNVINSI